MIKVLKDLCFNESWEYVTVRVMLFAIAYCIVATLSPSYR